MATTRLRRSDPASAGITRRRRGRGFTYVGHDGQPISDSETLARIRSLAIPPAWQEVWIAPTANGHLQAVGTDVAGRRQYLYHARWSELRSQEKFARVAEFARALPALRERLSELIDHRPADGPSRERVLATAVRLLDRMWLRIGSEQYAVEHGTYGLVTLRRSHLTLEPPDTMSFDFPAKHGIRMQRRICDAGAYDVLQVLRRRRSGPEALLAIREGRTWAPITAADVNEFLQAETGLEVTAKDFRTWHGTALCAVALASEEQLARARRGAPRRSSAATKRDIAMAVKQTADFLGNTPAVCRSAYIDPRLLDRYRDGRTIQPGIDRLLRLDDIEQTDVQLVIEAATLRLLDDRTPQTIARAAAQAIEEGTRVGARP